MKLAYNAPDFKSYTALLARDEFEQTFARAPEGFAGRWGYGEETAASKALFGRAYHVVLEMATTAEAVGAPPPSATTFTSRPLDVRVRVWREPTYCYYARGRVTFKLRRPDAAAPWLIAGVDDGTGPENADVAANEQTVPCSWADIKWHYLREAGGGDAGD
jgi:hypothetical protein